MSFRNHESASEFLEKIEDPIVKSLVRFSYQTILLTDFEPEGEFDLLYFFKVMEEFLRDRERLSRSLVGDFSSESDGWGA